jgi:hypothetical protein
LAESLGFLKQGGVSIVLAGLAHVRAPLLDIFFVVDELLALFLVEVLEYILAYFYFLFADSHFTQEAAVKVHGFRNIF